MSVMEWVAVAVAVAVGGLLALGLLALLVWLVFLVIKDGFRRRSGGVMDSHPMLVPQDSQLDSPFQAEQTRDLYKAQRRS